MLSKFMIGIRFLNVLLLPSMLALGDNQQFYYSIATVATCVFLFDYAVGKLTKYRLGIYE